MIHAGSKFWLMIMITWAMLSCEPRQAAMTYDEEMKSYREEVADFMNNAEDSPFAGADSLIKLSYFPVDKKFKVIANIKRIDDGGELVVGTSDGLNRVYIKHAWLEFSLEQKPLRLLVLKSQDGEGLFLAFADQTSDNATYGGGRYINLGFSDQAEKITLDFNKAYNPYCAYTASYSCPLPPLENYLKVAITAGEKNYGY